MMMNKEQLSLINVLPLKDIEAVCNGLAESGVKVLRLKGQSINNKAAFFKQAVADLTALLPELPAESYSSLSDSLWQGIFALHTKEVAIVWEHAELLLNNNLQDLLQLVDIFTALGRQLAEDPEEIHFYLLLGGEGAAFEGKDY